MRALRKIVFVNSANIRYAEVNVDGNVHFIGTQGVGKSTLLRAILFFYNADKLHLGIPKEKRSFDEFYLPHANSYIVYEVEHEHGPFSILVFRSSGRACYRFVDAAFQKEWLVDDHGEVSAEAKVIRERVGKAYMSKIIDRYEQYRDILYGNRQAMGKEFQRFQLMESNRYQNIPRSIQNVFLNSRLDADFIKDIIIRSMSDDEANIDLGYFRRQVADFEQEYRDISCWYKLNQKGESLVRKQADVVVKTYHELLYLKKQIAELCGELKYAERTSRERLPLIDEKINELTAERDRQNRLQQELQQKHDSEKQSINRTLGVVEENLRKCKQRKEFYKNQQIDEVQKRASQESVLNEQRQAMQQRLADLTAKYNDVTSKYRTLVAGVKQQLETFRQSQQSRIQQLETERLANDERALKEYETRKHNIEESFAEKLSALDGSIEAVKNDSTECEKALYALKFIKPYKQEIEAAEKELQELALREKELEGAISGQDANIKRLQAEYERHEADIKTDYEKRLSEKQQQIDELTAKISDIDALLDRTKGSLYEWLSTNVKGWEINIGRVIDEQHVLYQTGLHPKKASTSGNLYGVELDLSDLPESVRKPDELKQQKQSYEESLAVCRKELVAVTQAEEKAIDELKRKYSPQMKEMRQQKSMLETELQMIPQKRKAVNVQIEDYRAKGKQEINAHREQLTTRQQEIARKLSALDMERRKVLEDKLKQQKSAEKAFNDKKQEHLCECERQKTEILVAIKQQESATEAEVLRLQKQEVEELKGRGADTNVVEEVKTKIASVENELRYIEEHRKLIYDYQRDKEELFDKEDEFVSQKRSLTEKLSLLEEKYAQRRQKHEQTLASINRELNERKTEKTAIEEGLRKAENFRQDDNLCPPAINEVAERQTLSSPSDVVNELTSIIVSRQSKQNIFKQSVNAFKGNFSAKNTFNFRTDLTLDDDYLDFASNLDDFIVNNKIEEYRRRTSERYVDILARVSKEMGELTRHESDVDKIIHDINNDFKERNFVGVIKLIALQSVPSADKMVQLMKRIKEFNDENQFAMGEMNLFSTVNRDEVNQKAVGHLLDFMKSLTDNPSRQYLTLSDLFQLQFRVVENDNDTGWADKISHVGSEGTDTLVKAMVNIMLINVFKEKVTKKFGDFRIHCMMDEIGKLHPQNVKGILDFANARNILLINSSPTTYNVSDYRYTYLLQKDGKSKTVIHPLISQK